MVLALSLLACSGSGSVSEEGAPPGAAAPKDAGPLPEPRLGVAELSAPPTLVRASEVQDRAAPARLDVTFDPDVTTFEELGRKLEGWGFSVLDGDGESWRVGPPPGHEWPARLLPLPEIAEVTESVDLATLETGAVREGSERYGDRLHQWSWREGGPVETVTGGSPPPKPVLPHALPAVAVRCLAPVRAAMESGVSVGVGWERALVTEPLAWAVVLEDYGACKASGWFALRADASLEGLRIAERRVEDVTTATVQDAAIDYLRAVRPVDDPAAAAAFDLVRQAPTDVLARGIESAAPGPLQARLWQELDKRDPDAALLLGEKARSPSVRAEVTAEVEGLRAAALSDPTAPAETIYAALTVWRPGPNDPPEVLDRLKGHPSPRIRERAWDIAMEASAAACAARAESLERASVSVASALYRECPQQPVRVAAFNYLAKLDPVATAAMLRVVLEEPESVRTGILAARHTAALERYDLLEELVRRKTVSREVRRVALELVVKGRQPSADELVEQHGDYLGYRRPLAAGATADGAQ